MGEGHTHNTHKNTTIQNAQMSNGGYTTTRFRNQMENISCDIYNVPISSTCDHFYRLWRQR